MNKESERYFEDMKIGETRRTLGRTITETDFVIHAGHSGDYFPHHVDVEFCKTQPFKKPIAHGTMIFTIGVGLTAQEINSRAMTYGYEKIRFPRPVYAGDTIHAEVTIAEKRDHPKRDTHGFVIEKKEVKNQNGETVLYAEHLLLIEKRGG